MANGDLQNQTTIAALRAVGELVAADNERASIVSIGGAALQLLGIGKRTTRDVDIVAQTTSPGELSSLTRPTEPLPPTLVAAIEQVGRDFGLPENWLNTGPAKQWDVGLPDGFATRVVWHTYGGLDVGIASRIDLIFFKLEAAADQPTSNSRHFRDLVALAPTDEELEAAMQWARLKNVGADYLNIIETVAEHVRNAR
jgi:hypothetical protein